LSLLHPASQLHVIKFYQKYHSLICFYASRGRFSIRHPAKVGSTFSFATSISNKNRFKNDSVDLTQIELLVKNPAFFLHIMATIGSTNIFHRMNFLEMKSDFKTLHYWMSPSVFRVFTHIHCRGLLRAVISPKET
jgi:hypothetical protein